MFLQHTPWDATVFGIDTFEVLEPTAENLEKINQQPGHYTVKVNPLFPKKILHEYQFYYCDTLVEPYCTEMQFKKYRKATVRIKLNTHVENILAMVKNTFLYSRFYRDFNVSTELAENRFLTWIKKLCEKQCVYELLDEDNCAGFIAVENGKLLLHALHENYRGKSLAKYFWSELCQSLFSSGLKEITSSISIANLAVTNLYVSLGFRFRNPQDIYHRVIK